MPTLLILQGIPASGKSHWAAQESNRTGAIVVTRDDIRSSLVASGLWEWSDANERRDVVPIRDQQILDALGGGNDCICADTNLSPKVIEELTALASKAGAAVEFRRFPISVELAILRDSVRQKSVGEKVIRRMAKQWHSLPPVPAPPLIAGLPSAIICDLDGTLCIHNGRGPYEAERCGEDLLNPNVYGLVNARYHGDNDVLFVSGREDKWRDLTIQWLEKHTDIEWQLFMRPAGDMRSDDIVKREIYDAHIKGRYNVSLILDDRDRVVRMWRNLGLTCWQVNDGDF